MRCTLKKAEILRGKKNFQQIFSKGVRTDGNVLRCMVLINSPSEEIHDPPILVGFAVGKALKRAVDRNRVKRLMRESYRLNKDIVYSKAREANKQVRLIFLFSMRSASRRMPPVYSVVETDIKSILNSVSRMIRN